MNLKTHIKQILKEEHVSDLKNPFMKYEKLINKWVYEVFGESICGFNWEIFGLENRKGPSLQIVLHFTKNSYKKFNYQRYGDDKQELKEWIQNYLPKFDGIYIAYDTTRCDDTHKEEETEGVGGYAAPAFEMKPDHVHFKHLYNESELPLQIRRRVNRIDKLVDTMLNDMYVNDYDNENHFFDGLIFELGWLVRNKDFGLHDVDWGDIYDYIDEYRRNDINEYYREHHKDKMNESEVKKSKYKSIIKDLIEPIKDEKTVCDVKVDYDRDGEKYDIEIIFDTNPELYQNKHFVKDKRGIRHLKDHRNMMKKKLLEDLKEYLPIKNVNVKLSTTDECKDEMNESELTERCWKGYTQKGMKTMFGKRYPNCVKIKKKKSLRESIKSVLDEQVNKKYPKPTEKVDKLVYRWLDNYFEGSQVYKYEGWKYYSFRFEFCNNGRGIADLHVRFDDRSPDFGPKDKRPTNERSVEEVNLYIYPDMIKELLADIPIRKNYLLYLIEEWFEDTQLDKIQQEFNRNDLSLDHITMSVKQRGDICVPPVSKPEGVTKQEMMDLIKKTTLYSYKDIEKHEEEEPGWIEELYLEKLRQKEYERVNKKLNESEDKKEKSIESLEKSVTSFVNMFLKDYDLPKEFHKVVVDVFRDKYGRLECTITSLFEKPFKLDDSDRMHFIMGKIRREVNDFFGGTFSYIGSGSSTVDNYNNTRDWYTKRKNEKLNESEIKSNSTLHKLLNVLFDGFDNADYDWANYMCGMGECCDPYAIGFTLPENDYDDYIFKLVDGEMYDDDADYPAEFRDELPEPCYQQPDIKDPKFDTIVFYGLYAEEIEDYMGSESNWKSDLLKIINNQFGCDAKRILII